MFKIDAMEKNGIGHYLDQYHNLGYAKLVALKYYLTDEFVNIEVLGPRQNGIYEIKFQINKYEL